MKRASGKPNHIGAEIAAFKRRWAVKAGKTPERWRHPLEPVQNVGGYVPIAEISPYVAESAARSRPSSVLERHAFQRLVIAGSTGPLQ
jgi:hypothetical protein